MSRATRGSGGFLLFWCPGCDEAHGIPVDGSRGWKWNGSLDLPTVTPSILVRGTKPITDEEADRIMGGEKIEPVPTRCHSFVTDGRIQFLDDCTHTLAKTTVDIPDWDTAMDSLRCPNECTDGDCCNGDCMAKCFPKEPTQEERKNERKDD